MKRIFSRILKKCFLSTGSSESRTNDSFDIIKVLKWMWSLWFTPWFTILRYAASSNQFKYEYLRYIIIYL